MKKILVVCGLALSMALLGCELQKEEAPSQPPIQVPEIPAPEAVTPPEPPKTILLVTSPLEYDQKGDRIELQGTNELSVSKIVVHYKNEAANLTDEYPLSKFKKGDTIWQYVADSRYSNWAPGLNSYTIRAYGDLDGKETLLDEKEVHFFKPLDNGVTGSITTITVPKGNQISVDFLKTPQKMDAVSLLRSAGLKRMSTDLLTDENGTETVSANTIGTVKEGSYANRPLVLVRYPCNNPGCDYNALRVIQKEDGAWVVLGKYSSLESKTIPELKIDADGLVGSLSEMKMQWDDESEIPNFLPPETVSVQKLGLTLKREEAAYEFASETETNTLYTDPSSGLNILEIAFSHCPILLNRDGTYSRYGMALNFISENINTPLKTKILWNGGTTTSKEYRNPITGCTHHCFSVVSDKATLATLSPAGKTDKGITVYTLKYSEPELKAMNLDPYSETPAANPLEKLYRETNFGDKKPTIQEFYAMNPIVDIKDPFGRFVEFDDADYSPMAECGKPVIYLYPETETNVSVTVVPTGGFTKTEPDYGSGWNVRATPESALLNYADSKIYPYLFWEGKALNYAMDNKGFSVAREEVVPFLQEKLAFQGLNEKEIADFMEFWVPRMQARPYYFVTFVPQSDFDQMAPMKVSPRPDTVIRVFMDYRGLDHPITVEPQTLTARERKGFTVVEWGGELRE